MRWWELNWVVVTKEGGFPQESGLCSILVNISFNGFDKEIQDMHL